MIITPRRKHHAASVSHLFRSMEIKNDEGDMDILPQKGSKKADSSNWLWTCDNCGQQGPMTTRILQCPACDHHRCEDCPTEFFDFSKKSAEARRVAISKSRIPKADRAPKSGASDTFLDLSKEPKHTPGTENRPTPLIFIETPLSWFSPFSTQTSTINSDSLSRQDDVLESETENESTRSDSDEESEKLDNRSTRFENALAILDSIVLSVLDHDVILAGYVVDRIHDQLDFTFATADRNYRQMTSQNSNQTSKASKRQTKSLLTPMSNASSSSKKRNRRPQDPTDPNSGDEGESPKRAKKRGNENSKEQNFWACHFYKKDHVKYSAFSPGFRKYKGCSLPVARGDRFDRGLKNHFQNHILNECVRCFTCFESAGDLVAHDRGTPCLMESFDKQEGINKDQAEKISKILKVPRSPSDDRVILSDYEKWFEVWKILFPHRDPPSNPWIFGPKYPLNDIEDRIEDIRGLANDKIASGELQFDREAIESIIPIVRHVLEKHNSESSISQMSGSSRKRGSEPGNSTIMPESNTSPRTRASQSSGGSSGISKDLEAQSRTAKCPSPPESTKQLPFTKPRILTDESRSICVSKRMRDTASFSLDSTRLELPNVLYFQPSIPSSEPQRNAADRMDTESMDRTSAVDESAMSGRVDSNDKFTLTPTEQTVLHHAHHTRNHLMISGDDFTVPQTSYEGFHEDLDYFSNFDVNNPAPGSLPGLCQDNQMENSETLGEADQDLFGLGTDGYLDDDSWAAFLETQSVLAFDGVPQKSMPDGGKKMNATGTNSNDKDEE